jgi:hypothetical protein
MMNKFKQWYWRNSTEICWFIIGWLALAGTTNLLQGDWVGVVVDAGLIWVNLALNRR